MGVRNLWKILESAQKEESPTNETLGIDASIWIHRYRSINNTSIVVFSIIKRIISLLFRNNQLIFVFDGKTPPEKLLTVVKRNREHILTELKRHLKKINTNAPCKICSEPDEQILYRHCRHGSVDLNEFESVERLCSESLRNTKNIETWGRLIDDPDFMNESDDLSHHIKEIEEHVVPEGQSLKHRIMFVIYEDPSCDLNKLLPEKFA
ncbi:5'-3' exonuclease, partial [Pseudoloma neurophilia]